VTETKKYERLAVVVPVLNEVGEIAPWLRHIGRLLPGAVVVVADGGSTDGTVETVESVRQQRHQRDLDAPIADLDLLVVRAPRGRGSQLRRGAMSALEHAQPTHFLFLHVDTALDVGCVVGMTTAMTDPGFGWGWWDLRLDGPSFSERLIEWVISLRARLTGRPTGDQGLLVRRETYLATGGFEPIPLFEDVDIASRLRREVRGRRLEGEVVSSGRRYRSGGHWQTALNMWWLRLRWWLGARPEELYRRYEARPEESDPGV
jgi:rSAM/selenodomain-associated transferase 2